MSFDPAFTADLIARHGPAVRVLVAAVQGSSPREAGASMLVWPDESAGSIGGGALEWEALRLAREGFRGALTIPLGPNIGQCCGGSVTLVLEALACVPVTEGLWLRRVAGEAAKPLALAQAERGFRASGVLEAPLWLDGWLCEPVAPARQALWVWGAGHVGRALVAVMAPHEGFAVTWADTHASRFPPAPPGVTLRVSEDLAALVPEAPREASHLILTYSHMMDFQLCAALLRHGAGFAGLIGSKSKWARFRARLREQGLDPSGITCPIGEPALGKHPQAIAVGVAAGLLRQQRANVGRMRA